MSANNPVVTSDPIKHVIYLLLENHSFDQMLGCFKQVYPDMDGVSKADESIRFNADPDGKKFFQAETRELQMDLGPRHENDQVLDQLKNNNSGFVANFVATYPTAPADARQDVMGYYPLDFLPALHALARDFTICDQWYSSLPGPTWPNRFFALSGTSSGRVNMPRSLQQHPEDVTTFFQQDQPSIFDRLLDKGKSYRVFFYDYPSSLLLNRQREPRHVVNYRPIDDFFTDARDEPSFPNFCFIEPKYTGADENDDHPPGNVMRAEKLIADVYNAIRSNDPLWKSSLFVVAFDEHGGFYDHVSPPAATPPDNQTTEYTFDRYGVRVPALLISPYVNRGFVHTLFDHTSLLKYLIEKWGLDPLGNRTRDANSIGLALVPSPREETDTIPAIRVPFSQLIPPDPSLDKSPPSTLQQGFEVFAHFLSSQSDKTIASALEELAKGLGPVEQVTNFVGKLALKVGTALTSKSAERDKARAKLVTQAITNQLTPPGGGTAK